MTMAFRPHAQDLVGVVEGAGVLRVQTREEIAVLTAGKQLSESLTTVVGERESFTDLEVHRGRVSGTTRTMFRLALAFALTSGVSTPNLEAAPTEPVTKKSTNTASKATKKTAKKSAKKTDGKIDKKTNKKTATKADKRSNKAKRNKNKRSFIGIARRKPSQRTLAGNVGMPPGFSWPPTGAMLAAGKDCEAKLDRAGVTWERAEAEGRIANPIIVRDMTFGGIKYVNMWGSKAVNRLECQLALALETIGPELHAIGVREVRFGSIYRWSHVRSHGATRNILSRHALALAMDIGSFVDDAGRVVKVIDEYPKGDALLLAIEQVITTNGNFRIPLTPKNDPISHHDHFHIEARSDFNSP